MQGVFQAMESGMGSLVVSLLRLLVVVLPCAWWFSTFANAEFMIWFAFPIAEGIAFAAALFFLVPLWKRTRQDVRPSLEKAC